MKKLIRDSCVGLLDVLFPSLCEHCNRIATLDSPLCWRCIRRLDRVDPCHPVGLRNDLPAGSDGVEVRCRWYFDRQGPLRDVVHALKYRNRPWHGRFLGRAMACELAGVKPVDAVLPLPLHRVRLLERGYNQAEWMAAEIARRLDAPLARDVLSRVRPTFTQTNLSRAERWRNVSDAFAADATSIESGTLGSGCHVVLVDDVVTTGATAVAAALALRAAGVREVTVVAAGLARA